MRATIKRLSKEENEIVFALSDKMEEKQKEIDELLAHMVKLKEAIEPVKKKIVEKRKELLPFAEMKASIVNADSRDKYHPDDTKNTILIKAKELIK